MDLRQFLKAHPKPDLGAVKAKISASYSSAKQLKEARQVCQLDFDETPPVKKARLADPAAPQTHTAAATTSSAFAATQPLTPLTVAGLTLPPDFNRFKPVLLNLPAEFQRVRPAPPAEVRSSTPPPPPAPQIPTHDARSAAQASSATTSPSDPSKSQRRRQSKQKRKQDAAAKTKSVRFAMESNGDEFATAFSASSSAKARHRQKQAALRARASEKRAKLGLPSLPPPAWSSSEDEGGAIHHGNQPDSSDDEPLVAPKKSMTASLSTREMIRQAALSAFQSAIDGNHNGGIELSDDSSIESDSARQVNEAERLKTHAQRQEMLKARAEEKRLQVEAEAKLKALKAPELQAIADREARRQAEEATWMANEWARMEKERARLEAVKAQVAKEKRARMEADRLRLEEERRLLEAEMERLAAIRAEEERGAAVERSAAVVQMEARRKEVARQIAEAEARRQKRLEKQQSNAPDTNLTLNLQEDKSDDSSSNESSNELARATRVRATSELPQNGHTSKPTPTARNGPRISDRGQFFSTERPSGSGAKRRLSVANDGAVRRRGKVAAAPQAISPATTTRRGRMTKRDKATSTWYSVMMRQKESLETWHQESAHASDRVDLLDIVAKEKEKFAALEKEYWSRATGTAVPPASRVSVSGRRNRTAVAMPPSSSDEVSSDSSDSSDSESSDDDERGQRSIDDFVQVAPEAHTSGDHVPAEAPSQSLDHNMQRLELSQVGANLPADPVQPPLASDQAAAGVSVSAPSGEGGGVEDEQESIVQAVPDEAGDGVAPGGGVVGTMDDSTGQNNLQTAPELPTTTAGSALREVGETQQGPASISLDMADMHEVEKQKRDLELVQRSLVAQRRKNVMDVAVAGTVSVGPPTSFLSPPPSTTRRMMQDANEAPPGATKKKRRKSQPSLLVVKSSSDEYSSSGADDSDWGKKEGRPKFKKRRGKLARMTRRTARAMADVIEIVSDEDAVVEVMRAGSPIQKRMAAQSTNVVIPTDWIAQLGGNPRELERDEDGATLI